MVTASRRTPLHFMDAAQAPLVQRLVDMGFSPHRLDGAGNLPLHCAALAGNADAVRCLLALVDPSDEDPEDSALPFLAPLSPLPSSAPLHLSPSPTTPATPLALSDPLGPPSSMEFKYAALHTRTWFMLLVTGSSVAHWQC